MKQKFPILISIVVVSFNSKKELIKTLKSVYIQTFKNLEVIIVDKFSSDGTRAYLLKNKHLYKKLSQQRDKGIYDAMNKGINISKGRWIFFLNSGDILYSKKTLKFVSKSLSDKNDVVYGDTVVNNNGIRHLVRAKNFEQTSMKLPFCHQSVLVKNEILKKNKFNLKYKISADFDLFFRLFKKNFIFSKQKITISEIISGGISDTERSLIYKEYKSIKLKHSNSLLLIYYDILTFNFFIKKFLKKILSDNIKNQILKIKYYFNRVG